MSSNSTASPGADVPCCKATTLLAVAATTFVFCFLLLVAFLFLHFLLQRGRWRRSARLLQQQQHRPKPGLDATAIALIPSFPYRAQGAGADDAACSTTSSGPAECAVCLNILDEGQMARKLPSCRHVFHQECIDVWLASRASCPVCRGKAEPVPAEERAAASTSARVVAIEIFDNEVRAASSSTPGSERLRRNSGCG